MHFANPWGLLALLAIPAILTIHLFRRRYPPLSVAGLHLWSTETRTNPPGRRRDRLPLSSSLILELLAATLIALLLADPKFGRVENARHLIAVLDDSASMQGRSPEAGALSFRDAAIAALRTRMNEMPRGSRFTLILTGLRPTTLAGPAATWGDAEKSLEHWQPAQARHAFESAWDTALQLREQSGGDVLFLTDRLVPEAALPPWLELVAVGQPLTNVGISSVNWSRPSPIGDGKLFVQVQNHGGNPTTATVFVRQGDKELLSRQLPMTPGSTSSFEAPVPAGTGRLTVAVSAPNDGLAIDNVAELVEPTVRKVQVAIDVANPRSRQLFERGFHVLPQVQVVKRGDEKADPDIIVTSFANLPTADTRAWWLGVGPISTSESNRKQARNLIGPYLLDRRHPLLQGITLGGVVWGGVQSLELDVLPLVSAGKVPLFSQLNRRRGFVGILNIDLEQSNLGEVPDWPILLHNLVEMRKGSFPGLQRWNYHLGEEVQLRLFENDQDAAATRTTPLELRGEDYSRPLARSELLELPELPHAGVYEIRDEDREIGRFAVNFQDPEESNLLGLGSGQRPASQVSQRREIQIDSPYTWALLAGLAFILVVLFADWYVLGQTGKTSRVER